MNTPFLGSVPMLETNGNGVAVEPGGAVGLGVRVTRGRVGHGVGVRDAAGVGVAVGARVRVGPISRVPVGVTEAVGVDALVAPGLNTSTASGTKTRMDITPTASIKRSRSKPMSSVLARPRRMDHASG
jgi:hypothetical protein